MLLRPATGRFPVGCRDVSFCTADSTASVAADNHVVGRLFYPAKAPPAAGLLQTPPPSWISNRQYARGYLSWGLRSPSSLKEHAVKELGTTGVHALGLVRRLGAALNAAPEDGQGPFPVIIFSHGAASMRNTCSVLCTEFASRGFVVAAIEHADGTACCVKLATGEWKMLQGLGTGAVLEAKCTYRVGECLTMAAVLQALNAGSAVPGICLSGPPGPAADAPKAGSSSSGGSGGGSPFRGLLDLSRLVVMGHSCGGATAAAAAAEHSVFRAGVSLDPWWPLLPRDSPALTGWATSSPLLVVGSQDWSMPGTMFCDGERQAAVFRAAAAPRPSEGVAAEPHGVPQRVPVVAAATAAPQGTNQQQQQQQQQLGGGAVQVVPAHSSHGSFTDLPFLMSPWLSQAIRRLVGGKGAQAKPVSADAVHAAIVWSVHRFLTDHLALAPGSPSSLEAHTAWAECGKQQQQQEQQEGQQEEEQQQQRQEGQQEGGGGWRQESLADHLAADEGLMAADEAAGHHADLAAAGGPAAPPPAHAPRHDVTLDEASGPGLAAVAAARRHVPVRAGEDEAYRRHLGSGAYLVAAHTAKPR